MVRKARATRTRQLEKNPTLKIEQFKTLKEWGFELPQLVLGIKIYKPTLGEGLARDFKFKPGRKWLKIAHESGGLSRHQNYLIGSVLTPESTVLKPIANLVNKWTFTDVGNPWINLNALLAYSTELVQILNVECNFSWKDFETGIYPLDLDFLPKMTSESLPGQLDDLILWNTTFERTVGETGRWGLWILAGNMV